MPQDVVVLERNRSCGRLKSNKISFERFRLMPPMIEFPLDLPEVRVLKTELKKREIVITVESTRPYAICSQCGQKTFEFHSYGDPIRLRHLPILE
jgi:hypothetical protein